MTQWQPVKDQPNINGLTPVVLAELASISISYAYRLLDGTRFPGLKVAQRLAEATGMGLEELVKELQGRQRAA